MNVLIALQILNARTQLPFVRTLFVLAALQMVSALQRLLYAAQIRAVWNAFQTQIVKTQLRFVI